jgi:hypothetical protein
MNSFIEFTNRLKHHDPTLIEAIQCGYSILHESFSESADTVLDIFEYMESIKPDIIEHNGNKALLYSSTTIGDILRLLLI